MKIRLQGRFLLFALALPLAAAGCGSAPSTGSESSSSSQSSSSANQESVLNCDQLPFVENVFWTTNYGPASADIKTSAANFLPCNGPAYALCYYSGAKPLPCKVDTEKGIAECVCYGFKSDTETYDYFIDINAILNTCSYIETVRDCGHDGAKCLTTPNSAPACQYMNQTPQTLQPGADLVSTFSLAKAVGVAGSDSGPTVERRIGCTDCPKGLYAGCMTAPCYERQNDQGEKVVVCECPLYEGPFQVGQDGASCDLGDGLVWSAAYDPSGCPDKQSSSGS